MLLTDSQFASQLTQPDVHIQTTLVGQWYRDSRYNPVCFDYYKESSGNQDTHYGILFYQTDYLNAIVVKDNGKATSNTDVKIYRYSQANQMISCQFVEESNSMYTYNFFIFTQSSTSSD